MRSYRLARTRRVVRWQSLWAVALACVALACTVALYSGLVRTPTSASALQGQLMAIEPADATSPTPPDHLVRWVMPTPDADPPQSARTPVTTREHAPLPADEPTFNGRPLRPVKQMAMRVTAYSPDARSCGRHADGITASGYSVWTNGMKLVAADTRLLPFGTIISIPGYNRGQPVQVLDRGGKIKGHRLDVLYPTHEIARRFGVQNLHITVWEYAD